MTDQLPPNLVHFGEQYERAAKRELPRRPHRRGLTLAVASSAAVAAIAAAVVIVISATTGASPAYALTRNSDGSITITLNNLTTGIPELNARFRAIGIDDYTVVPVTANCPTTTPVLVPGPGSMSEEITIGTKHTEPPGAVGFLAAEQLPDGQIAFASGSMRPPLPSCFSPRLAYSGPISSSATSSQSSSRRSSGSHAPTTTTR